MTNKTVKCAKCGGTGRVPDDRAIGLEMKSRRLAAGVSLTGICARIVPKITAGYVSDLERGNRRWLPKTIESYLEALKK